MPVPWHSGQGIDENLTTRMNSISKCRLPIHSSSYYRSVDYAPGELPSNGFSRHIMGNLPTHKRRSSSNSSSPPAPQRNMRDITNESSPYSLNFTEVINVPPLSAKPSAKNYSSMTLNTSQEHLYTDLSATLINPNPPYQSSETVDFVKRNKMLDYMDQLNYTEFSIQPSFMNSPSSFAYSPSHQMLISATQVFNPTRATLNSAITSVSESLSNREESMRLEPNLSPYTNGLPSAEYVFLDDHQTNIPFYESQSLPVNPYSALQPRNVSQIADPLSFCELMERLPSNQSALSSSTRSTMCLQEQSIVAARLIMPKSHLDNEVISETLMSKLKEHPQQKNMTTMKSGYQRPKHDRVYCTECDSHPEGFRGEHEFRRHRDREHNSQVRKFICIEPSDGKDHPKPVLPLSKCKACSKQKKKYNAYYNAAAHLRRAHFKPKSKGRPRNKLEGNKRGGKGGGDWPSMTELKYWMKEVREPAATQTDNLEDAPEKRLNSAVPDSKSDTFDNNNYDLVNENIPAATYEPPFKAANTNICDKSIPLDLWNGISEPLVDYHLRPYPLMANSNAFNP